MSAGAEPITSVSALTGPMQPMPTSGPGYRAMRTVRTGDCDRTERLRLDGIARYLQDAATDHIAELGLTDSDGVWVVRRTVIDVLAPIRRGSRIELRRWCSAMSTRWATMRADLSDGHGGRVETEAFWIKIDPATGMPSRIGEELETNLVAHTIEHRLRWRALLPDAVPESATIGSFPLRGVDIDMMEHLNNAVYLQAVEDAIDLVPQLREDRYRTVIEYLRPIAPGSDVELATQTYADGAGVWFVVDGAECARVRVLALG